MTTNDVAELLARLTAEGEAHDAQATGRAGRRLNLEPDTAQLISILVASSKRRQVLELGTSNGVSTIWLAQALQPYGGRLTSVELLPEKQAQARQNLHLAHLADVVDLQLGDAATVCAALPGPFDVVFFDADRRQYPQLLATLLPKLTPDCLLLADNVLSHPDEVAPYLTAVAALPGFVQMIVPTGKGLSVAYRAG